MRFHRGNTQYTDEIDEPQIDSAMETTLELLMLSKRAHHENLDWRSLALMLSNLRSQMDDLMCAHINDGPWGVTTYETRDALETTTLMTRFAIANMHMQKVTQRTYCTA